MLARERLVAMESSKSLPAGHHGRSLAFTIGVIRRSFVWTILVAIAAVSLVVAGGASADSPRPEVQGSLMLASADGK